MKSITFHNFINSSKLLRVSGNKLNFQSDQKIHLIFQASNETPVDVAINMRVPQSDSSNRFAIIDLEELDKMIAALVPVCRSSDSVPEISRKDAAGTVIFSVKHSKSSVSKYPLCKQV